ncbi:MAG: hypothetical protein JWM23_207 [Microbacteriaceae bacterium]|nr:hypothetical protein [Microbacteriaceae bacterium]
MFLLLLQYGPAFIGLLLALGVWCVRRRSYVTLPLAARVSTVVGMVIGLGCVIAFNVWSVFPTWIPSLGEDRHLIFQLARYIFPLLLCAAALLFLLAPVRVLRPHRSAELVPRTLVSFASRSWLVSATAVTVGVVIVSVLAGLASSPDEAGRYVMYGVTSSASTTASTTIYGWWFSLPCLALIAIIVAIALMELVVISRPPLAVDRHSDIAKRTARVRGVLAVSTGGLLLHLGAVLQSLYGASTLRLELEAGLAGRVELGSSFAAIGPVLLAASHISAILGIAMWWGVLLCTLPTRTRQLGESARI